MYKNFECFDGVGLVEPNTNRVASTYISENYDQIVRQARKMGVAQDKVDDLVHDVFLSIFNAEENGEGYDEKYGESGSIVTPAEFVFGRLRGYAKNDRYKNTFCERRNPTNREDCFEVISASADGEDFDSLDSFQKAYASAASYNDDIDTVELRISLRQNIKTCCDYNESVGFNMMNLFRNMDMFKDDFSNSLFDQLRDTMRHHSELGEAFKAVMEASLINRNDLELVLEEIGDKPFEA